MATRLKGLISLGVVAISCQAADLPPLNTPATPDHYSGKIVWDDLFTSNPTGAVKFYSTLFGWTAQDYVRPNRTYTVMSMDGRPIAGITLLPEKIADASPNAVHGRWVGFVSVPDVAKAAASFKASGGQIISPARLIASRGTQAIVETSDGVIVGLLNSTSGDPGEYRAEANEFVWSRFFVKNPTSTAALFHDALGYDAIPETQTDKPDTFVLSSHDFARAGLGPLPADRPSAKPGWLGFIRVENLDDMVAKAKDLGAKVLVQSLVTGDNSKMAILSDPTGASFGLVQLDEATIKEAQP